MTYDKKTLLAFAPNEQELRTLIQRLSLDIEETTNKSKKQRLKEFLIFVEQTREELR